MVGAGTLGTMWLTLNAGEIRIRQALKVERSVNVVLGPLKTAGSRRTLSLPMPVVPALLDHRVRQDSELGRGRR